ncbi:histidine phosphatase family protein [Nocardioides sp.]|uniref:histidine phosphatase family protein n=1 Tax=Nocardioides sp. TaxID=35761 RepID=UPI00273443B7|nr:histidine phosphatase family protein [Nocardioides sp.]MDP3889607.1 histidine phosphatase family protein [Nocardioides sp.]
MGSILLVRHGQGALMGDGAALAPLGWEQSRLLGVELAARGITPDLVVHGDHPVQCDTAAAVAEAAGWTCVPEVDAGWDDVDLPDVLARVPMPSGEDTVPRAELDEWLADATSRWTAGRAEEEYAESFRVFADRVDAALSRAARRVSGGTAVVVTSGAPIALVAASLLHREPEPATLTSLGATWRALNAVVITTSVTKVVLGRRGATLVVFNEHGHLEGRPDSRG